MARRGMAQRDRQALQEAWALGLGLVRRARRQGQAGRDAARSPVPSGVPARVRRERIHCEAEERAVALLGFPSLLLPCLLHKPGGRADLRTCRVRWAGWRGRDSPAPSAFAAPARPCDSALLLVLPHAPVCPMCLSLARGTSAPWGAAVSGQGRGL